MKCLESTTGCLKLSHVHPLESRVQTMVMYKQAGKGQMKEPSRNTPSQQESKQSSLYANCQIYYSHMRNSGGAGLVAQTSAVQYLDSLEPQVKILAGSVEIFSFPSQLKKSYIPYIVWCGMFEKKPQFKFQHANSYASNQFAERIPIQDME